MLILTRKIGQTINIGLDIEVKIVSIDGNQVRVGIAAPKNVPVNRAEIHKLLMKEEKPI